MNKEKPEPDLVIRHEIFGIILYSLKLKSFFIPKNKEANKAIKGILSKIRQEKNWREDISEEIIHELESIGLNKYVREIFSNRKTWLMSPLELYFDFTDKCNLRCSHCYNKTRLSLNTIPQEKVREILKEAKELGIMRIHLAGGEPTLEEEGLINYLKTTKELRLVTSMSTNAILLTPELCEKILSNNLYAFTISLEGHNSLTNDIIRGEGTFERAVKGLEYATNAKRKLKVETQICIKTVCNPDTPREVIEGIAEICAKYGVSSLKLYSPERSLYHEKGFYGGEYIKKYYQMVKLMEGVKEKFKERIEILPVINPLIGCAPIGVSDIKGCIGGNELLTINPNGDITPCLMMHEVLGNIYNTTLKDFWDNSSKLTAYREKTHSPECDNCNIYQYCKGGCQVRKKVEFGEIKGKDPLCPKDYNSNIVPKIFKEEEKILLKRLCNFHSL
jgi:radical SAM protein with 4Fe4S-binding SPASM domain